MQENTDAGQWRDMPCERDQIHIRCAGLVGAKATVLDYGTLLIAGRGFQWDKRCNFKLSHRPWLGSTGRRAVVPQWPLRRNGYEDPSSRYRASGMEDLLLWVLEDRCDHMADDSTRETDCPVGLERTRREEWEKRWKSGRFVTAKQGRKQIPRFTCHRTHVPANQRHPAAAKSTSTMRESRQHETAVAETQRPFCRPCSNGN